MRALEQRNRTLKSIAARDLLSEVVPTAVRDSTGMNGEPRKPQQANQQDREANSRSCEPGGPHVSPQSGPRIGVARDSAPPGQKG